MVVRRCPQCGTPGDDIYGFCIKCGYEFAKVPENHNACPLCGYPNPDEADYCVKCGTPLIFKSQFEKSHTAVNPIIISNESTSANRSGGYLRWIILAGYVFSILGGLLGLIIAIYLSTRKDANAKKHGHIQLAIFGFYILLVAVLYFTGMIPPETFTNYQQLILGNMTLP